MTALPPFALSIRQPWAWAIVNAGKDIENRDWATKFRGPVCIHASKGMTNREWDDAMDFIDRTFPRPLVAQIGRRRSASGSNEAARGGIIATAEIAECVTQSESPWFFGKFGFVLRNVQPVPFIPCKGALGFFRWEPSAQPQKPAQGELL